MNLPEVGVVVGRFQTPELTEGHRRLLDRASEHGTLIVVLGVSGGLATARNPLDAETRRQMILWDYPRAIVTHIKDQNNDEAWSALLDKTIETAHKAPRYRLYGSRDSFIKHYTGKWPTQEILGAGNVSATESRLRLSGIPHPDKEFRSGAIYAAMRRLPQSYQAVDIAVVNRKTRDVLLGGKLWEPLGRFPGGFVDPTDESLEYAAARELEEETGLSAGGAPAMQYIGSYRIDDWRYRDVEDGILTALFVTDFGFGKVEARDDLNTAYWVKWPNLKSCIMPAHLPLAEALLAYLKGKK